MTMIINQSLADGLNILLLFDVSAPSFTVSEISKRLGYSQSKAYRLVRTLIKYNFLQEDRVKSRYSLGISAFRLGLLAQKHFNIGLLARPFMKEVSLLTKETVLLVAVNKMRGVVLQRVESEEPVRLELQIGASIPLPAGASGKILMAYLPEDEWDRIITIEGLKRYAANTITNKNKLKAHLREIRKMGYTFSDQEVDPGGRAVSAPILNSGGELVAGLSIAGPVHRMKKDKINSLVKLVVQYAHKISTNLV